MIIINSVAIFAYFAIKFSITHGRKIVRFLMKKGGQPKAVRQNYL